MKFWRGNYRGRMLALLAIVAANFSLQAEVSYVGVNLTGPEYGEDHLPGVYNTHYTYPTSTDVDYFMGKGMNTFRVPFSWERMQPTKSGPLDSGLPGSQLTLMDTFVDYATSHGASVILDPHNFAAYYGEVIGAVGSTVTADDFGNLWSQLATHYKDNDKVIFGLMNEPVGLGDSERPGGTTEQWLVSANKAIDEIRKTGASNLILVPGNGYSGGGNWSANFYGTPNDQVMGAVVDPMNNFAYEVHQYMDENASGKTDEIYLNNPALGAQRLAEFTLWLQDHNARGFLGEFGAGSSPTALAAIDNLLNHVDANSDVWLGWTYWAAGPWNTDFMSIQPDVNGDKPQLAVLQEHIVTVPEPGPIGLMAAAATTLFVAAGRKRRGAPPA